MLSKICQLLLLLSLTIVSAAQAANLGAQESPIQKIPTAIAISLDKNQIPQDSVSISVVEIKSEAKDKSSGKSLVNWRANAPMNPASTMKILTTLTSLDVLGPQYRWRTNLFTDGTIRQGILKGNIYLQGTGDPKLVPEELAKMMNALQNLGIQKIDGDLFFDRSAYSPEVMLQTTIDGESTRSYNVSPDPLLYAFRTLSFHIEKSRTADFIDLSYTPALSQLKVTNQLRLVNKTCDNWKSGIGFALDPEDLNIASTQQLNASFSGVFPSGCKDAYFNVVALNANTFLTQGFAAAWELAGGVWVHPPAGKDEIVPISARPLLQFEGSRLADDVVDINKYSNNVMARQLFLTLALEKMGKPASIEKSGLVIQDWLKKMGLDFPGLVIENGSGLSRNETITAQQMNALLLTARNLPIGDTFYNSLPIAGTDGTMKNRLLTQLRKFFHLKKKPEVRIKTGSLANVRAISGYVISKSGRMYAVTSFINHPNAWRGLEAHDQLLAWLLEDGPEPKQAR